MKIIIFSVSIAAALLSGCSSESSSSLDPELNPQDLTYFSLDEYRDAAEFTDQDSIVGTWVGTTSITYTDVNYSGDDSKRYESRLEFFVIREASDGKFEIASCNKLNFVDIKSVSDTQVSSVEGVYNRNQDNVLTVTVPEQIIGDGVSIYSRSEYVKILDTSGAVGKISWDWSTEGSVSVINEPVFCAAINRLEHNGIKISNSTNGEKKSVLQVSDTNYPFLADLSFDDRFNDLSHLSDDVLDGNLILDVNRQDVYGFSADFSILASETNSSAVVGNISIDVTF